MTVPESGNDKVKILRASGEALRALEAVFNVEQAAVVNDLIEESCWSTDAALRDFVGGRGTPEERLSAILNAIDDEYTSCPYCNGEPQPTVCSECGGTGKALLELGGAGARVVSQ
ncbi:hypothetical protein [Undibacterium sp. WLX3042]|uniref:hypothetical protein n=1 Tax=Undibacterium sp. WLX3042 TaxID=3412686 RepID=UPI003C2F9F23